MEWSGVEGAHQRSTAAQRKGRRRKGGGAAVTKGGVMWGCNKRDLGRRLEGGKQSAVAGCTADARRGGKFWGAREKRKGEEERRDANARNVWRLMARSSSAFFKLALLRTRAHVCDDAPMRTRTQRRYAIMYVAHARTHTRDTQLALLRERVFFLCD